MSCFLVFTSSQARNNTAQLTLYSFYNLGWNALTYTYMVEIFPFQQRSQGIAVEQMTVRFAVFFNTYVNPIALNNIGWRYYIVYCGK